MESRNGHHSSHPVPEVIVSDYDGESASPPDNPPNPPVLSESEEEDREIIEALTRAHPTNVERHVGVDGTLAPIPNDTRREVSPRHPTNAERQANKDGRAPSAARREGSPRHPTNAERQANTNGRTPNGARRELSPRHRSIAERHIDTDGTAPNGTRREVSPRHLTVGERHVDTDGTAPNGTRREVSPRHLTVAERHVDTDGMLAQAAHCSKREGNLKENVRPATTESQATTGSPKRMKQETPTDDDIADMEVSRLTSSLESKRKFSPNSSILKRPTASFAPPPVQPLPGSYEASVPRLVPRKKDPILDVPFVLPPMIFQPLREMSFSAESTQPNDRLSTNGTNRTLKNRRSDRLYAEGESDSAYSNGSSPDERPPRAWKTPDSATKEEEINRILSSFHVVENSKEEPDDNRPSTSKNSKKQDSSKGSRKSKD